MSRERVKAGAASKPLADDRTVELSGVRFGYAGTGVLMDAFDLDVRRGEMMAVVGPNGSGKTTLLRLMAGSLAPLAGQVRVCGEEPARARRREFARRVAVVGQQNALGFPFTVLEVVLMGRAPHVEGFRLESAADLDAARHAMEATQVLELAERDFDQLSSGERQRVAVARALAQEPELMLLDEPAAFLDIKQQILLYDLLAELNCDLGLTVVSVLHDLNLASLYFQRVAMLKEGSLYALGAPEEVITYQTVRDVFDTDVYVDLNSVTGKLNILPLPRSREPKEKPA